MTSYTSLTPSYALPDSFEDRTAFRQASRSQSPQKSSISNPSSPKRKIFEPLPDNSSPHIAKTDGSKLGKSPSRLDSVTPKASVLENKGFSQNDLTVEKLILKVDNVLKKNPSPMIPLNLSERPDIPSYNQFTPMANGFTPMNAYNLPMISDLSRYRGSSTPSLKQSVAMSPASKQRKNDIFVKKDYGNVLKNNQIGMPLENLLPSKPIEKRQNPRVMKAETPKATILPTSNLKLSDTSPMSRQNMSDQKSRTSSPEKKVTIMDPNNISTSTNVSPTKNEIIFPITPKETHKKAALPIGFNNSRTSSPGNVAAPMIPTLTHYPTNYSPERQGIPLNTNLLASPGSQQENLKRSPYIERLRKQEEITTQFDPTVSDKLYKTIDNLISQHFSEQRSPDRSVLFSQKPNYTSPINTQNEPASSNPLYRSTVFSTTVEPVHKSTPSAYANDYASPSKYYSPLKYDSTPTYEPVSKYEPYSTYEVSSTYEPYRSPFSTSNYEPLSTYQPKYESYSTYEPLSTYQPTYNYEKDLKSTPHRSSRPSTSDYDHGSESRSKYVRPLYRNTPDKYAPKVTWSSDTMLSTPVRDSYTNQDNNSTDRKMKKLTLKSRPIEERDSERESYRSRRDHGKKGSSYSDDADKLTFRNTGTDNEGPADFLPLPIMDSPVPTHKKKKSNYRAGDLLPDTDYHAGNLLVDDLPPRQTFNADDLEDDFEYGQRKQVEAKPLRKVSNNIPDDGKEWKMAHRIPSHLLDEEPETPFSFETAQKRKAARPSKQMNSKPGSKAEIWDFNESLNVSHTRSVSDLSQSVKKSKKKPLISHCFEKSERLGY